MGFEGPGWREDIRWIGAGSKFPEINESGQHAAKRKICAVHHGFRRAAARVGLAFWHHWQANGSSGVNGCAEASWSRGIPPIGLPIKGCEYAAVLHTNCWHLKAKSRYLHLKKALLHANLCVIATIAILVLQLDSWILDYPDQVPGLRLYEDNKQQWWTPRSVSCSPLEKYLLTFMLTICALTAN